MLKKTRGLKEMRFLAKASSLSDYNIGNSKLLLRGVLKKKQQHFPKFHIWDAEPLNDNP